MSAIDQPNISMPDPTTSVGAINNPTTAPGSGFGPIPKRVQDLPQLVVDPTNQAVGVQVADTLDELAHKLATVHVTATEAWLSQANYEKAMTHMSAAVSLDPANLDYVHQLGVVRYLAGDDAGAIEAFDALLKTRPNDIDALYNLGIVLFGKEEFATAEICFSKFLELEPAHAEAWNNRGVCFFQQGRRNEAVECFQKALTLEPNNQDAQFNLQNC